jgi:hypothetical protein
MPPKGKASGKQPPGRRSAKGKPRPARREPATKRSSPARGKTGRRPGAVAPPAAKGAARARPGPGGRVKPATRPSAVPKGGPAKAPGGPPAKPGVAMASNAGAAAAKGPPGKGKSVGVRKPPSEEPLSDYDRALRATPDRPPEKYRMSGRYVEGQRIQHTAFGLGVVLRIVNLRVIDVVFKTGTRRLAMAR